jgi:SAM-dependent methyltransferase
MPERADKFDAESVREDWDRAADAYAVRQESGQDYYRYEFFGPAQVAACGDVRGLRVLDVGCGSGYFSRELARRGASVVGIDMSPGMLAHAMRHESAEPLGVAYVEGDAAGIGERFDRESFDLAVSCVALQDMPDVPRVLRGVRDVLKPGGRFVASITHPCTDTPYREWARDDERRKKWLCVDRYFERGPVRFTWIRGIYDFETTSIHVPLEDWFEWILGAGFRLRAFREPRPSDDAVRARPDLEDAARVPYFVIFDLARD